MCTSILSQYKCNYWVCLEGWPVYAKLIVWAYKSIPQPKIILMASANPSYIYPLLSVHLSVILFL